jgi:hypothetical protein
MPAFFIGLAETDVSISKVMLALRMGLPGRQSAMESWVVMIRT